MHNLPYTEKPAVSLKLRGPACSGESMIEIFFRGQETGNSRSGRRGSAGITRGARIRSPYRHSNLEVKVSNESIWDFVREGGPAPHFWSQEDGQLVLPRMLAVSRYRSIIRYGLHGNRPDAYARWRGPRAAQ